MKKKKLIGIVLVVLVIIILIPVVFKWEFPVQADYMYSKIYDSEFINYDESNSMTLNIDKADSIVTDVSKKQTYEKKDKQYQVIRNILNNRKVSIEDEGILLLDLPDEKHYYITLKNSNKSSTYQFCVTATDGKINPEVLVIMRDYYKDYDVNVKLNYGYFLETKITFDEFKKICPDFNQKEFFKSN